MKVELLFVPGCPNVMAVRDLLAGCIRELGLAVEVDERAGDFPSPTILVDGVDVMGDREHHTASCRFDVPTHATIVDALNARRSTRFR